MADKSAVETIKLDSQRLRGTLGEGLADPATGAVADADTVITKFHGIYQQDDRDQPQQWRALDTIANGIANGSIRLTSRQAVQFHGVAKEDLRALIRRIDAVLMDSLAACGDVNRNVMCHVQPEAGPAHARALAWANRLSAHLTPRTRAWREIFVDGQRIDNGRIAGGEPHDVEPVYGRAYLPRKFKIAVAMPPVNDVDIYTQDLGFIAIAEGDRITGFNVAVGGGMGCSHGEPETFPRLADVIGFIRPRDLLDVAEAVVTIQRDYGDRDNRKHARFKYTLEDLGLERFRRELEWRARTTLQPPRAFTFEHSGDRYGWTKQTDGRWQLTVFVENGRLLPAHRRGLEPIVRQYASDLRLTPNQNLVIAGVAAADRGAVDALVDDAGLGSQRQASPLRLRSMACVALPTCGMAMAEAERYLPALITRIEELAARHGLAEQAITVRMSGCPNGCSRPYLGEIGFVGRAPGRYNMYLGAAVDGSRLNRLYLDNVDEATILEHIDNLFERFAAERHNGEAFGEYVIRAGIVAAVEHGRDVHGVPAT